MVVVTGIKTAIKIAPIIYKGIKIVYKGSIKTKRGAQWMARHPKIARYGTIAASSAPIIYDLMNIDYSAIQKTKIRSITKQQTRGNVQSPSTRQLGQPNCYPRYRHR